MDNMTDKEAFEWLQKEWPLTALHMEHVAREAQGVDELFERVASPYFSGSAREILRAAARYKIAQKIEEYLRKD